MLVGTHSFRNHSCPLCADAVALAVIAVVLLSQSFAAFVWALGCNAAKEVWTPQEGLQNQGQRVHRSIKLATRERR